MWSQFNHFSPKKALALFGLALLLPSCGTMEPLGVLASDEEIKVENPGFFDIGAGYGVARSGDDDFSGYLFSVKAYPAGRWYSNAVTISEEAKKNITEALNDDQKSGDKQAAEVRAEVSKWDQTASWSNQTIPIKNASPWKRFSVFYGHSLGDFEGGSETGSYKCIGIGYDIAPEFAVQVGVGALDPTGGGKLDYQGFIGISLNLNAFKSLVNGASL